VSTIFGVQFQLSDWLRIIGTILVHEKKWLFGYVLNRDAVTSSSKGCSYPYLTVTKPLASSQDNTYG
jgi:hypothetical protein